MPPASAGCPPAGRARVAHRVPTAPCGRLVIGGGVAGMIGRAAGRRAGGRRRAGRRRPGARRRRARRRLRAERGERAWPSACATQESRCWRRPRRSATSTGIVPVWSREHAASGSRRAAHRSHRLDRAAADVRGQRPARGDAVLRRAAPRRPLRGAAREGAPWSRRRPTAASSPPSPCTRRASRSSGSPTRVPAGPTDGAVSADRERRGSRCCGQRRGPRLRTESG